MTPPYIFCILEAKGSVQSKKQIFNKLDDDMNRHITNRYHSKFTIINI